jgi:hypothetical protein
MTAYSCVMNNFNYANAGAIDEIIMPNVNLSAGNIPMLTFWLAYAPRISGVSDTLEVVLSTDCGNSWTGIYKKWTDSLMTASPTASAYVADLADWRQEVIDLSPYSFSDNVTIKLRNINNNQNNLYIDDINITMITGINERLDGKMVGIYPNPTTGNLTVNTSALTASSLKITISDAVGKTVLVKTFHLPALEYDMDLSGLGNGIYLLHADDEKGNFTKKLVVNR